MSDEKNIMKEEEEPLERPREQPAPEKKAEVKKEEKSKEEPVKREEPEPEKEEAGMAGGTIGIIVMVVVFAIMAYFLWFNKGAAKPGPSPTQATQTVAAEDTKPAEALVKVKEMEMPKTHMKMVALLDSYKAKKEKEGKVKIEPGNWSARSAEGKIEPSRYYEITFQWNEDGKPVIFAWEVDMKSDSIASMNQNAKDLDKFEGELWVALSKGPTPAKTTAPATPAASPEVTPKESPVASPTVVAMATPPVKTPPFVKVTPTPGAVKTPGGIPKIPVKPIKKGTEGIDILPPETPVTKTKPGVKETVKAPPTVPPKIPSLEYDEDFYELTGVMSIGSSRTAMLQKSGKAFSGSVGTKLPGGWTIQSIATNSATLKKGADKRTIQLKEAVSPYRSSTKEKEEKVEKVPKAKKPQARTSKSGHPTVPEPDIMPPSIDKPEKGGKSSGSPEDKPTVIPID